VNDIREELDFEREIDGRWDKLTAEMLLGLTEWSQGCVAIEQALTQIVSGFGAVSGTLSRVRLTSGSARIIATTGPASKRELSGLNNSFAHPIMGDEVARLKHGALILMSQFEDTRSSRDPAIEEWLIRRGLSDVGFICLTRDQRSADFLELHFAEAPNGAWTTACEWGAAAFARTYSIRRPGLVTEALARHSGKINEYDSQDWPILAPENAAGLTRSEWRVCVLVSRGLMAKAVANEIGVEVSTVRSHLRKIYLKTNLGSYHQLARRLVSRLEQHALHQGLHERSA